MFRARMPTPDKTRSPVPIMNRLPLFPTLVCLFVTAFLAPATALADRIVMQNGDVITGRVTRVDAQEVTIDPPYANAFSVKRDAVASIETGEPLEVELESGDRLRARFAGAQDGRQVVLPENTGTAIEAPAIHRAAPPRDYYARESRAEGTVTLNEGNTVSRSSIFDFDTRLRLGDHRQCARFLYRRDENDGETTKKQTRASYEYDWLFRRGWYIAATAAYERDPIRELGHRFTFGALLGHDLIDAGSTFLTIKAGAGYTDETLGATSQAGAVGLWELEFRHGFGLRRLEFVHEHALTYQNYGANNTILASNTGLRLAVLGDIYATAGYRYNYESEPAPGRLGKDATLTFGLGAKF
jgi:putative salt-induced outer membrane protein YdiY